MPIGDIIGRMTIELIDNDTSMPIPRVTFSPVGRFTPAMISFYATFFASQIQQAQTAVRTGIDRSRPLSQGDGDEPAARTHRRKVT